MAKPTETLCVHDPLMVPRAWLTASASFDQQHLKSVGDQFQTMIKAATVERNKAAQTGELSESDEFYYSARIIFVDISALARDLAQWMGRAPNTTIVTQVLIGALATALGAALSGNNVRIHSSFLHHNPFLTSSSLDIGGLHPRRRVDSRGVLLGTRAWFERAPGITSSGEDSQPFPARGRGIPVGTWARSRARVGREGQRLPPWLGKLVGKPARKHHDQL
jgi:hypothetical protein